MEEDLLIVESFCDLFSSDAVRVDPGLRDPGEVVHQYPQGGKRGKNGESDRQSCVPVHTRPFAESVVRFLRWSGRRELSGDEAGNVSGAEDDPRHGRTRFIRPGSSLACEIGK